MLSAQTLRGCIQYSTVTMQPCFYARTQAVHTRQALAETYDNLCTDFALSLQVAEQFDLAPRNAMEGVSAASAENDHRIITEQIVRPVFLVESPHSQQG